MHYLFGWCVITQYMCHTDDDFYLSLFSPCDMTGRISVISVLGGLMLSYLCAVTPAVYLLCIIMAQVAGQEDREKSTALKGKRTQGCNKVKEVEKCIK